MCEIGLSWQAACLAAMSALSLPSVLTWARVQAKVTFLAIQARLLAASAVLSAVVDVKVLLFSASKAAWESEMIFTYLGLWLGGCQKNSHPCLIPSNLA